MASSALDVEITELQTPPNLEISDTANPRDGRPAGPLTVTLFTAYAFEYPNKPFHR